MSGVRVSICPQALVMWCVWRRRGHARGEEARDRRGAYCEGVEQQTTSLDARAITAYASCLELARTGGAGHGFLMACEEALEHEDPGAWPAISEMFSEANYTASRPVAEGLQPFARWSVE